MAVMLTRMGLQVEVAADGGEAERKLQEQPYDFVFMGKEGGGTRRALG
jgi:CheY-like chemotaxis protein